MSDGAPVPAALPEPLAPVHAGRRRASLAWRTAIMTAGVAALVVLIAGLVSYPLIRGAAEAQAQQTLARQADLVANLLDRQISGQPGMMRDMGGLARVLRDGEVTVVATRVGEPAQAPLTSADVELLGAGGSLSEVRSVNGSRVFVEGRPLPGAQGVVLLQPVSVALEPAWVFLQRLLLALVIALVLAVIVGLLASRRVTQSLRRTADAAERLAAGDRDVRVPPEGPAEVADLAEALNRLAGALAVSENRQREFLLSVSHELRTPLTGVKGYAEALADGVVTGDDVPRTGAVMLSEAERLERLVSDLLDLSRAGAADLRLDLRPVDLTALAAQAGTVWSDRCQREGVVFRLEVPATPVVAVTDPLRVRQIVDNLAENALRVTPSGSPVVLAVAVAPGSQPGRPAEAVVQVRDGGPGLTPDDISVAFQPAALYARYRGVRRVGTGVGLALVLRLADRLGGTAEAGRAPEGGASFSVRLPLAPAPAGAPVPLPPPGPASAAPEVSADARSPWDRPAPAPAPATAPATADGESRPVPPA